MLEKELGGTSCVSTIWRRDRGRSAIALVLLVLTIRLATAAPAGPHLILPKTGLEPRELAIIVNELDPASRKLADYYATRRGIPEKNLIRVEFPAGRSALRPDRFRTLYSQVRERTPDHVQAYALAWTAPYRVGCMSMTSAFAFGYDDAYCAARCQPTRRSPYFASPSVAPFADNGVRLTMMLAGRNPASTKALIDRGVAADESWPEGTAYLVSTSDAARNVRAATYSAVQNALGPAIRIERIESDYIEGRADVMFYFTGLTRVPEIHSNRFLPGAVADHLTSTGGRLTDSEQMSALEWLEAGATGSFGTVVEPCNFPSKFPNPGILMASYVTGATLIEAYWRSVEMPGQGVFIGEPLARPFSGYRVTPASNGWSAEIRALPQGFLDLEVSPFPVGPYTPRQRIAVRGYAPNRLNVGATANRLYLRLRPVSDPFRGRHSSENGGKTGEDAVILSTRPASGHSFR